MNLLFVFGLAGGTVARFLLLKNDPWSGASCIAGPASMQDGFAPGVLFGLTLVPPAVQWLLVGGLLGAGTGPAVVQRTPSASARCNGQPHRRHRLLHRRIGHDPLCFQLLPLL